MTSTSEYCDYLPAFDKGWQNVNAMADLNTLHPVPWAGHGDCTIGEYLCETQETDGTPQLQCPRFLAQRQLERLEKLGYSLYSAFECRMMIREAGTGKMLWDTRAYSTQLQLSHGEKLLLEVDHLLARAGVNVESNQK